jgi:hypothetical protein
MAYDYTKKKQDDSYDPEVNARALQMIRDNAAQQRQQALQPLTQQKNEALSAYLNRGDFQYDFNADALYQNYKDRYTQLGKMAMQDTMGQAAALTGGYGSSYAQNVGQQAYNQYMTGLADVIPELYQMAYARYQDKGNDLLQRYSLLAGEEEAEYARQYQKEQEAVSDYQWQAAYDYQAEQDRQAAMKAAEQEAGAAAEESILQKPIFSHVDEEGLYHYYLNGKEVKYAQGVNPLTGTINPDVEHGTLGITGYQPSHITINGKTQKLTKTGIKDKINGHEQNIWQAEDESLWMWDDTKGEYTKYTGGKIVGKIVNTKNIDKFKQSIMPRVAYGNPNDSDVGYKNYIAHKIEEAESYLTDDEVYTLGVLYGLIEPPADLREKYGYHLPG